MKTHTRGQDSRRADGGSDEGGGCRGGCRWKAREEWGVLALADRENRTPAGPDDKGKGGQWPWERISHI